MALTDTFVRQVKHGGAPAGDKHVDGQGLYLLVTASGQQLAQHEGKDAAVLVVATSIGVSMRSSTGTRWLSPFSRLIIRSRALKLISWIAGSYEGRNPL